METIKAKYASTQSELNTALDTGERVIIVQGNLYNEIKEVAEKSQKSKVAKSGGKAAVIVGLIVPLVSLEFGLIALAGGAISYILGKNADSLKSYDIDIDEVKKEIILSKKKGKDKVHKDDVIER